MSTALATKPNNVAAAKSRATKIVEEALKLRMEARAALAGSLVGSVDEVVDENIEATWADEIAQRIDELDTGKAKTVPWSEARRRLLSR